MTSKVKLSRKQFFLDVAGRILTVAIGVAEANRNDQAVNRLLRMKDRLNRRRAK